MELRTLHQRKARLDREPVGRGEPCVVVDEGGVLAGAAAVEVKAADRWSVAEEDLEGSFHSGRGVFLTRTRLGRCSSSS